MPTAFKERNAWVVKWKNAAGRWQKQRTDCATKAEAKAYAAQLEHRANLQRHGLVAVEEGAAMSFGELVDWHEREFSSVRRSESDTLLARRHLEELRSLPLVEVTAARIDRLLTGKADELAPKTVNNLRAWIQGVFARAIQRQLWSRANPAEGVPRRKVPKRVPSFLRPPEVEAMLWHLPEHWRGFFAAAVYTGMRRGEVAALQKRDVDLEAGTVTVTRSWRADTTKGRRARLVPIHPELKPYIEAAMKASKSALVFPREDGSMQSEHAHLPRLLRSALNAAGITDGWRLVCRRCGHDERSNVADARPCPDCGFKLWPSAIPRRVRFHDLRHTTATLMLKSGASLAVVQRMLGHTDPNVTANTYGHLDVDDLRVGIERLSFGQPVSRPEPVTEAAPAMAASDESWLGLPVVPRDVVARDETTSLPRIPEGLRAVAFHGPTRIRTWNQAVMRRAPEGSPGPTGSTPSSVLDVAATSAAPGEGRASMDSTDSTGSMPRGLPVVPRVVPAARRFEEVLTVREVAARLKVNTATVYAMVGRGELEAFRVRNAIRVRLAALERLMKGRP